MRRKTFFLALVIGVLSSAAWAVPERRADSREEALNRLSENAGGEILASAPSASSAYSLLRATGRLPLLSDAASAEALERALNYLAIYGVVQGVRDPMAELAFLRATRDAADNRHVHLTQQHQGLPVFGARLVVHMNARGIYGVSGVFVPDLAGLSTTPVADLSKLRTAALIAVQKTHPGKLLSVESTQLMVYRSGLLEGHVGKNYLAYEALVRSATGDVRERVILDAIKGGIINRISLVHAVLNREIYTPGQVAPQTGTPIPPVITEGAVNAPADIPLSGDGPSDPASRAPRAPIDNLYIFAGGTYALYKNLIGREGYDDGVEMQVQKSVYLVNDQCPNAYWNGDSTNYCPGFDADDVVSHEWSHAYTQFTHDLVYQYQSGALNESYSDIFGEMYDLVNGIEGPLGASLTEGDYYENGGSRWVVGEDLSQAAATLLLRDMWDPDNFGNPLGDSPGSVITSPNYYCGHNQSTAVHTNSGVPNHAFAMLVDGKEFNGVVIPKIGMTKAAQIYLQAELHHQTPTTNFAQHADALDQSCQDLKGVALKDVLGNISTEVITTADCAAVAAAMVAVEMRQSPKEKCGYRNILQPEADTPAICPAGQFESPDFKEDWEKGSVPSGWTQTQNLAGDTDPQPFEWVVTSSPPAPHNGKAVFADNNGFGSCAPGGDTSASFSLDTPEITVADDASYFKFSHFVQTEFEFDGGNLKFSINGSAFALVPAGAFVHNGHSGTFGEAPLAPGVSDPTGLIGGNNTSPLAGQAAWTGSDQGESTGSWGTTIVDLATLGAGAGDKVKFRYDYGQDGCGGNIGWFVDEVAVLHCSTTDPNPPPVTPPPPVVVAPAPSGSGSGFFLGVFTPWMLFGILLLRLRRSGRLGG
ncbi:MAG: M4 family metallopeptidase [Pseudomonadota bacterium]